MKLNDGQYFNQLINDNKKVLLRMYIEYLWLLLQGKIYLQMRLRTWTSFIGQFFHPVRGEGME